VTLSWLYDTITCISKSSLTFNLKWQIWGLHFLLPFFFVNWHCSNLIVCKHSETCLSWTSLGQTYLFKIDRYLVLELTKISYIGTLFEVQVFSLYILNSHRFPTLGLHLMFSLYTGFQFIQGSILKGFAVYYTTCTNTSDKLNLTVIHPNELKINPMKRTSTAKSLLKAETQKAWKLIWYTIESCYH
jgi:hypothetical protein